jgi:hypothetical protein
MFCVLDAESFRFGFSIDGLLLDDLLCALIALCGYWIELGRLSDFCLWLVTVGLAGLYFELIWVATCLIIDPSV